MSKPCKPVGGCNPAGDLTPLSIAGPIFAALRRKFTNECSTLVVGVCSDDLHPGRPGKWTSRRLSMDTPRGRDGTGPDQANTPRLIPQLSGMGGAST